MIEIEEHSFTEDIRRYIGVSRHWLWLIILTTCVAGVLAFVVSKRMTPIYQASTTLLVNEAPSRGGTDYTAVLTSERLTRTYAQMLTKTPILQGVIDQLGLDAEPKDLQKAVEVNSIRDTQLIDIRVRSTDPALAAAIANRMVEVFADQNQGLQASRFLESKESLASQLAATDKQIQETTAELAGLKASDQDLRDRLEAALVQYRQSYSSLLQSYEQVRMSEAETTSNVVQVEPAVAPEKPILPRTLLNVLGACALGFLFGTGIAFLIEALDNTLRTPDDINEQLGLPVLGLIAQFNTSNGKPVALDEPRSPVAEAFRTLRTNLQFASVDLPLKTILITSPSPSEGKSTIAANLGTVLAQSGKKVMLVDADLRRPRLHSIFHLQNRYGLSDLFVSSNNNLGRLPQKTMVDGLSVLTTGDLPPNPSELLGSEKMSEIIQNLTTQVDTTIIDSPPVMMVTDASVLASRVDGVILVIKQGETNPEITRHAIEQLKRVGANILGVVFNDVKFGRSRYYYYHYNGYYLGSDDYYYGNKNGKKSGKRLFRKTKEVSGQQVES